MITLQELEPATLAPHADAVLARLEDSSDEVRLWALYMLRGLEPATLAQHVYAVLARLEDSEDYVRSAGLSALAKLEPATLAQHTDAVLARLEDSYWEVRLNALQTLAKLEPATLAQHFNAVIAMLDDFHEPVRDEAMLTLGKLPRFFRSCDYDFEYLDIEEMRTLLLGRRWWYKYRIHLRVQRLALYWYALPYRPSGPGHARDVAEWDRMIENQDQGETTSRKTRCKKGRVTAASEHQGRAQTRNTRRKK